jgi:hypothetical protein
MIDGYWIEKDLKGRAHFPFVVLGKPMSGTARVSCKIRTENLPNTSLKWCPYSATRTANPSFLWRNCRVGIQSSYTITKFVELCSTMSAGTVPTYDISARTYSPHACDFCQQAQSPLVTSVRRCSLDSWLLSAGTVPTRDFCQQVQSPHMLQVQFARFCLRSLLTCLALCFFFGRCTSGFGNVYSQNSVLHMHALCVAHLKLHRSNSSFYAILSIFSPSLSTFSLFTQQLLRKIYIDLKLYFFRLWTSVILPLYSK